MKHSLTLLFTLLSALLLSGCEQSAEIAEMKPHETSQSETQQAPPKPPTPPLSEDFEGEPQLSLFPRAGDYQPPRGDQRHPYWETFIEHLTRTSGLVEQKGENSNRAWSFRGINSIDSVGYFSPVAVEPLKTYKVTARVMTDLPEKATAGIGLMQFDEFLWHGEQYDEETVSRHHLASLIGFQVEGKNDFEKEQTFFFTTLQKARMVHLVLFREGAHNRSPVMFDDISIEEVSRGEAAAQEKAVTTE